MIIGQVSQWKKISRSGVVALVSARVAPRHNRTLVHILYLKGATTSTRFYNTKEQIVCPTDTQLPHIDRCSCTSFSRKLLFKRQHKSKRRFESSLHPPTQPKHQSRPCRVHASLERLFLSHPNAALSSLIGQTQLCCAGNHRPQQRAAVAAVDSYRHNPC